MFEVDQKTKTEYYKMFDRTEKMVDNDVTSVKNWFQTQPHLPEIMDEVKIRNFLNMNKFSIEKTKQKIDMYYTMRSLVPEMFKNPKRVWSVFENIEYGFLPKLLDGMHRVHFMKLKKTDSSKFDPDSLINIFLSIFEIRLSEDFMTDDVLIVDYKDVSLGDLNKYTPSMVAKCMAIYQKVYSTRMNAAHYLNSPSYITIMTTLIKRVLKPKLFNRIHVHEGDGILNEIFSKQEVPKDYGGDGLSLSNLTELLKKKLVEYQGRFDLLETLKVDEKLRPEKLDNDEILGFYGNFKKLDVD